MTDHIKMGVVQMAPSLGNLEHNLQSHLDWLKRDEIKDADIVVFPELSLTGYLLQDLVAEVANPVRPESPLLAPLLKESLRRDIVVGMVEQSSDFLFYNSAVYLSKGGIRHVHRKVYLPTYGMFDEGRYFAAGSLFRPVETAFGRIGILICEDAWHVSSPYLLALQGAHTLIVLSGSPSRGWSGGGAAASVRAWERVGKVLSQFLTVHWVYVNRVGYEDGLAFAGGSYIAGPSGDILLDGEENKEDVYQVELSLPALRRARTLTPILRDEKRHVVLEHLKRIEALHFQGEPRK
ncbi:MAG: nitrilase-related carbon-nitrogen hydrolase [Acidobacteriota bacterium]